MKKLLLPLFLISLVAAGCNISSEDTAIQNTQQPVSSKQNEPVVSNQKSDNRTLWTPDPHNVLACDAKVNNDPPTETVQYKNDKYGISMKLPYSPNWGSDQYKLQPYDELPVTDNVTSQFIIYYGPLGCGEGGVSRTHIVQIIPHKTNQQWQDYLNKFGEPNVKFSKDAYNHNILTYGDSLGMCSMQSYVILGSKYDYDPGTACRGMDESVFKTIRIY